MPPLTTSRRCPMQFDPSTSTLFTDAGERIKTLHCPRKMQWTQLEAARDHTPHRHCRACDHVVLETAVLSDADLLAIVRADPSTCLQVRSDQPNLTLVSRAPDRGTP